MAVQRDVAILIGGVVIGAVALVLIGLLGGLRAAGDAVTPIHLQQANDSAPCVVVVKPSIARVRQNKKITWEVKNYCKNPQLVILGNFRSVEDAPDRPTDCETATYGTDWPFKDDVTKPEKRRASLSAGDPYNPDDEKIELKVKEALGSATLNYYYDVCLDKTRVDPMLVIDP